MHILLFWIFTLIMVGFGIAVIANRNPVASALCLVVSFVGLAALYISLDAFFIGTIQILVYAGAVMVLFLFIIMLLDLRAEERRPVNWVVFAGGGALALTLLFQISYVIGHTRGAHEAFPPLTGPTDDVRNIGALLFSQFNLPFQVIGVLIFVATIGVIILSKRELR